MAGVHEWSQVSVFPDFDDFRIRYVSYLLDGRTVGFVAILAISGII